MEKPDSCGPGVLPGIRPRKARAGARRMPSEPAASSKPAEPSPSQSSSEAPEPSASEPTESSKPAEPSPTAKPSTSEPTESSAPEPSPTSEAPKPEPTTPKPSPSGPAPVSAIGDLTCENAKVSMDRVNAANPIRFPSSSDALYGDSLGVSNSDGATYIGSIIHNVTTLVTAWGGKPAPLPPEISNNAK